MDNPRRSSRTAWPAERPMSLTEAFAVLDGVLARSRKNIGDARQTLPSVNSMTRAVVGIRAEVRHGR